MFSGERYKIVYFKKLDKMKKLPFNHTSKNYFVEDDLMMLIDKRNSRAGLDVLKRFEK